MGEKYLYTNIHRSNVANSQKADTTEVTTQHLIWYSLAYTKDGKEEWTSDTCYLMELKNIMLSETKQMTKKNVCFHLDEVHRIAELIKYKIKFAVV